jgi:HAUS augmin-like complex subunit 1
VHRAREEVIQALKERDEAEHPRKKEILENIEAHLEATGEKNVNDLAEMTTVLGSSSTDTIELAHAIMELTRDEFDAANQVQKVESLQNYLNKEMDSLQKEVTVLLADPAYTAPAELSSQTMEWVRSAKMLGAKVNEYRDRIASLQRNVSTDGSTIPDLVAEEEKVIEIQESVNHLEKSIKAFYDLPPNLEDAKKEYKRLERELDNLTQERDKLLEKAVSRG